MKILYDHQIFVQRFGGISRYFFQLMKQFQFDRKVDFELSLKFSSNNYLSPSNYLKYSAFLKNINFRGKPKIEKFFNEIYSISKIKKAEYDIFHATYYDPYFLRYINNKPFVLTVYDMIPEKLPHFFSLENNETQCKKNLTQKARKIICISESTKKDLMEIFDIEEGKIDVIYLASSFTENDVKKNTSMNLPKKYILFVGRRNGYKNFDFFIKSVAKLFLKDKLLKLLCAGSRGFTKEENDLFKELKIQEQVIHFPINSDCVLAELYKNALCFVFPSLYEGFGIPILEAFSCNCPVICSNLSSFPEVAGNAALYFDPNDEESIAIAVKRILDEDDLRKDLINKGRERGKEFSWKKCAQATKELYESILQK